MAWCVLADRALVQRRMNLIVKALPYSKAVACIWETVLDADIIGRVVDLRTDKESPASVGHTTPVGLNFT
jgi:hypothetical protein